MTMPENDNYYHLFYVQAIGLNTMLAFNLLVDAQTASFGTANSFLCASHVSRTRYVHQVTAGTSHIFMKKAYDEYVLSTSTLNTFKFISGRPHSNFKLLYYSFQDQ